MDLLTQNSREGWTRRRFAATLTAGLAGAAVAKAQSRPPNILLITSSQHRGDTLSGAGHAVVRTPVLDLLIKNGVLMRRFFAAAPESAAARASLLSGRYPKTHGVHASGDALAAGERLLPELLREHGYRTGLAGRLGLPGADKLFDSKWDFPDDYSAELAENHPGTKGDPSETGKSKKSPLWEFGASVVPFDEFPTFRITDHAIDFLKADEESEQPWFLKVGYWKPHGPYVLPRPWNERYPMEQIALPDLPEEKASPPTPTDSPREYVLKGQSYQLQQVRRHYYGAISFVDEQISRILQELTRIKQLDNTVIVFTSDCGNMLGEHGRMFAGVPYDGATHVPAVFYHRGVLKARRVEQVVDGACLTPTLLQLAGLPVPKGFEAEGVKPLLTGDGDEGPGVAFSEFGFHTIRTRDWKLTLPGDHPTWTPQLFDLANDPGELVNVFDNPETSKIRKELEGKLAKWLRDKPSAVRS